MMLIVSFVITLLGTVSSLVFIVMLYKGKQYTEMFEPLDDKAFPMKSLYGAGYALLETIRFSYVSRVTTRLKEEAAILYDRKYSTYYMRVTMAQSVSFAMLVLCIGLSICGFAGSLRDQAVFAGLVLTMAFLVFYNFTTTMKRKLSEQADRYFSQFPDVVSKLALLITSGMILREAWTTVAYSSDEEIYMLMRETSEDIKNGLSESEAYYHFGIACGVPEIRKFISMLVQNLSKGTADLANILTDQSAELWARKKQIVLQKGEMAASKLMMPIGAMFVGILIIIIVPLITNMNF